MTTILGPRADAELSKTVRHDMQLDLSVPHQVWNFVTGVLQGNLGVDFTSNEQVTTLRVRRAAAYDHPGLLEPPAGSA